MDNLSDIIPLLVILGSIILSIVGGSKKKNQQESADQPGNMPSGSEPVPLPPVDSFWEELEQSVQEEVIVQPVIKKPLAKKLDAKISSLADMPNKYPEEVSEPLFRLDDLDEVKKGIIYSEILNRREY